MKILLLSIAIGLLLLNQLLAQGDLLPPPGPPAPTMKTLDQIEARTIVNQTNTPGDAGSSFVISASGSYYLTGNLNGENARNGILITASNVTLDLNGFAVIGVANSGYGITCDFARNLTVRRGTVRGWGFTGLNLERAANSTVEQIRASNNGINGPDFGAGISVGFGCVVNGCVAFENSSAGITDTGGATVSGCVAQANNGPGFLDAFPGGSTFTQCAALNNVSSGFGSAGGSTFTACTSQGSTSGDGFALNSNATITGCTAQGNGVGIFGQNTCIISNNNVSRSRTDGIVTFGGCLILNNNVSLNGTSGNGDGIQTINPGNRIDGNHTASNNGRGIRVLGGADFVVRNTSISNTAGNYAPTSGSFIGPIGGTPNTATSPWANF